jgi:hypothetical protein
VEVGEIGVSEEKDLEWQIGWLMECLIVGGEEEEGDPPSPTGA